MKYDTTHITASQYATLNSSPVELIPQVDSGKYVVLISGHAIVDYKTQVFTRPMNPVTISHGGAVLVTMHNNFLKPPSTNDKTFMVLQVQSTSGGSSPQQVGVGAKGTNVILRAAFPMAPSPYIAGDQEATIYLVYTVFGD